MFTQGFEKTAGFKLKTLEEAVKRAHSPQQKSSLMKALVAKKAVYRGDIPHSEEIKFRKKLKARGNDVH